MLFKTFLKTEIEGKTPKQLIKEDFVFYKDALNLKGKEDIVYNNLFDNLFWILENKFGLFTCLYKDVEVMYREMNMIVSSQIPQLLFLQKKQLLESLDTFGDINNWGSTMKDSVKRDLNVVESGDNSTGYLPIDGDNLDPYSKDSSTRNTTRDDKTTENRNTVDFLYFFSRMKWNTASIEFTTILKPYYNLFLAFDIRPDDFDDSLSGYEDLENRVSKNENDIETLKGVDENIATAFDRLEQTVNDDFIFISNRIDDNKTQIDSVKESIKQVEENTSQINATLNQKANLVYDNNFKGNNTFNGSVFCNYGLSAGNSQIVQVAEPIDLDSAANKRYVDNKFQPKDEVNSSIANKVDRMFEKIVLYKSNFNWRATRRPSSGGFMWTYDTSRISNPAGYSPPTIISVNPIINRTFQSNWWDGYIRFNYKWEKDTSNRYVLVFTMESPESSNDDYNLIMDNLQMEIITYDRSR